MSVAPPFAGTSMALEAHRFRTFCPGSPPRRKFWSLRVGAPDVRLPLVTVMLGRRGVLIVIAAALLTTGIPGAADAGVARAIALRELVRQSRYVVVGAAVEAVSRWEDVGKSRRIVTYHRFVVDRGLGGKGPADKEVWIRTLGGRVGDIGQIVHGEAVLTAGETAVVFLAPGKDGVLQVTAMSLGHFPVLADKAGVLRLNVSPRLSHIIGPGPSAVDRLVGKTVGEADSLVQRAERGDD